ncbi:MAG: site-specific integrase [Chitinophagales bacterium]|nr:site-specific integrase [Chitinophagales bacterium]
MKQINTGDISQFIAYLHELDLASSSQARIISGLRSFFTYRMEKSLKMTQPKP